MLLSVNWVVPGKFQYEMGTYFTQEFILISHHHFIFVLAFCVLFFLYSFSSLLYLLIRIFSKWIIGRSEKWIRWICFSGWVWKWDKCCEIDRRWKENEMEMVCKKIQQVKIEGLCEAILNLKYKKNIYKNFNAKLRYSFF